MATVPMPVFLATKNSLDSTKIALDTSLSSIISLSKKNTQLLTEIQRLDPTSSLLESCDANGAQSFPSPVVKTGISQRMVAPKAGGLSIENPFHECGNCDFRTQYLGHLKTHVAGCTGGKRKRTEESETRTGISYTTGSGIVHQKGAREIDRMSKTDLPSLVLCQNCLENLADYIESLGGNRNAILGGAWSVSMEVRIGGATANRRDYSYKHGEKVYRSKVQVARFLSLSAGEIEGTSGRKPGRESRTPSAKGKVMTALKASKASGGAPSGGARAQKPQKKKEAKKDEKFEVEEIVGTTVLTSQDGDKSLGLTVKWVGYDSSNNSDEPYSGLGEAGLRYLLDVGPDSIPGDRQLLYAKARAEAWYEFVTMDPDLKGLSCPFREKKKPEAYIGLKVDVDCYYEGVNEATIVSYGDSFDAPYFKASFGTEDDFNEMTLTEVIDGWKLRYKLVAGDVP